MVAWARPGETEMEVENVVLMDSYFVSFFTKSLVSEKPAEAEEVVLEAE